MKFQRNYRSDVEWLKENSAGIVKNAMEERATENGNTTTFVMEQVAAAAAAAKRLTKEERSMAYIGGHLIQSIPMQLPLHCLEVKDWRHASIHLHVSSS